MAAPPTDSNAEGMTFGEQFFTLTGTYWIANLMEMFERLAY